jgi:hypothetical protein
MGSVSGAVLEKMQNGARRSVALSIEAGAIMVMVT